MLIRLGQLLIEVNGSTSLVRGCHNTRQLAMVGVECHVWLVEGCGAGLVHHEAVGSRLETEWSHGTATLWLTLVLSYGFRLSKVPMRHDVLILYGQVHLVRLMELSLAVVNGRVNSWEIVAVETMSVIRTESLPIGVALISEMLFEFEIVLLLQRGPASRIIAHSTDLLDV